MLPFTYAVRNLARDPARALQTVLGSALVALLVMTAGAIHRGMDQLLANTGSPHNVILLGTGSEESLERSEVPAQTEGLAGAAIPGIATDLGQQAISTEIHYMAPVRLEDGREVNATFRGVGARSLLVHRQLRLIDGDPPAAGEIIVGRLAHRRLGARPELLRPGRTIEFADQTFAIAGVFAAPGTALESELWFTLDDLMTLSGRRNPSAVVLRLEQPDPADAALFTFQRSDLELAALTEQQYYHRLSEFYTPIRIMTWLTAALIATGAVLGGLNTLYAAFASRIQELATLQTIGFTRLSLLFSLVQESMLACLSGTLLATLAALLLLDGLHVSFSIGVFQLRADAPVLAGGLAAGVLLGLVGALPAAWGCLTPSLPRALRAA